MGPPPVVGLGGGPRRRIKIPPCRAVWSRRGRRPGHFSASLYGAPCPTSLSVLTGTSPRDGECRSHPGDSFTKRQQRARPDAPSQRDLSRVHGDDCSPNGLISSCPTV